MSSEDKENAEAIELMLQVALAGDPAEDEEETLVSTGLCGLCCHQWHWIEIVLICLAILAAGLLYGLYSDSIDQEKGGLAVVILTLLSAVLAFQQNYDIANLRKIKEDIEGMKAQRKKLKEAARQQKALVQVQGQLNEQMQKQNEMLKDKNARLSDQTSRLEGISSQFSAIQQGVEEATKSWRETQHKTNSLLKKLTYIETERQRLQISNICIRRMNAAGNDGVSTKILLADLILRIQDADVNITGGHPIDWDKIDSSTKEERNKAMADELRMFFEKNTDLYSMYAEQIAQLDLDIHRTEKKLEIQRRKNKEAEDTEADAVLQQQLQRKKAQQERYLQSKLASAVDIDLECAKCHDFFTWRASDQFIFDEKDLEKTKPLGVRKKTLYCSLHDFGLGAAVPLRKRCQEPGCPYGHRWSCCKRKELDAPGCVTGKHVMPANVPAGKQPQCANNGCHEQLNPGELENTPCHHHSGDFGGFEIVIPVEDQFIWAPRKPSQKITEYGEPIGTKPVSFACPSCGKGGGGRRASMDAEEKR